MTHQAGEFQCSFCKHVASHQKYQGHVQVFLFALETKANTEKLATCTLILTDRPQTAAFDFPVTRPTDSSRPSHWEVKKALSLAEINNIQRFATITQRYMQNNIKQAWLCCKPTS